MKSSSTEVRGVLGSLMSAGIIVSIQCVVDMELEETKAHS